MNTTTTNNTSSLGVLPENRAVATIKIPFVDIFWGTGDELRLARQTDCMYQLPYGLLAWSPQGVPKELYPHPRVNLIDRQTCHEALLRHFDLVVDEASAEDSVAKQLAKQLHSRLNEEIGIGEFVYLLMGSPSPSANPGFSSVFSSANEQKKKQDEMPKYDPVEMLTLAQQGQEREGRPLLVILPPPIEYYPDEEGPICAVDETIVTVEEIEKALIRAAKTHKKTVLEFLRWIESFSFDNMSSLPFVPVLRETKTVPDHVLYMPDVVNKAMIWSAKTKKYYPA